MSGYPHHLQPAGLPVKNSTAPFWLSQPSRLAKHRTTRALPQDADVIIIGSGLSGASLAYNLIKKQPGIKILMLEAREVASGATARNGGHIKQAPYSSYKTFRGLHGPSDANDCLIFESIQLAMFQEIIDEELIDCSFNITTAYDIQMTPEGAQSARENYLERKRDFPDDMANVREITESEELERLSGVKGGIWGASYLVGSVWPYKLVCGILEVCLKKAKLTAGGWFNLQTNTAVDSIAPASSGSGWTVKTSRGTVSSPKVVLATNGWTSHLLPSMADQIVPVRGTASSLLLPPSQPPSTPSLKRMRELNASYAINWGTGDMDYMITRQEGKREIILGGAKSGFLRTVREWYGRWDDDTLMPGAVEYFTNYMPRVFKNWSSKTSNVDKVWTGVLGYSSDLLPWVGQHPSFKGLYVQAAFHGHGMPRILGCSRALSDLIVSGSSTPSSDKTILRNAGLPAPYCFTSDRLASDTRLILGSMGQVAAEKKSKL